MQTCSSRLAVRRELQSIVAAELLTTQEESQHIQIPSYQRGWMYLQRHLRPTDRKLKSLRYTCPSIPTWHTSPSLGCPGTPISSVPRQEQSVSGTASTGWHMQLFRWQFAIQPRHNQIWIPGKAPKDGISETAMADCWGKRPCWVGGQNQSFICITYGSPQ